MSLIPENITREIRDRVNIVDLIGRYVSLRKAGANYKGLCPFHNEKSPSFNVNIDRQIFHCFGCGEGGDAIGFLMRHENLTFPEAVRSLAQEVGIEIPETGGERRGPSSDPLFTANEVALALYREALMSPEAKPARTYLAERGFDAALAERFEIGYAPDRWDAVTGALATAKIPASEGVRAGLLIERDSGGHYDRLRGRVVFPIRDVRGRVVGFGGRALSPDQEPKYLNTPETPIFQKRSLFFGFPGALEPMRRTNRAVIVEGYFDQIAMCQAGVEESVATCGTALTETHASNLRRRTGEVVLVFDGDAAGQKAMERALEILLPAGLRVRAVLLPPGDDPDSLLHRDGAPALRARVEEAPPAIELIMREVLSAGASTPWQKADVANRLAPLLAKLPDPVERTELIRRLALMANIEQRGVERAVSAAARGERWDAEELVPSRPRLEPSEVRRCRELGRRLLDHPQQIDLFLTPEILDLLPGGFWIRLFTAMLQLSSQGETAIESKLLDTLEGEDRQQLRALLLEPSPDLEEEMVIDVIAKNLAWLKDRRSANLRRAATERVRANPEVDVAATLAEKQRQLEERQKSQGL